jgi:hypothetical protein
MESEDYPRTLAELEARFSSEEACREYLFQLRWPDGFRCPRCGAVKAWPLRSGRWQCVGAPAGAWMGQLPDSLDVFAQATASHDPAWTRAASRHGRS